MFTINYCFLSYTIGIILNIMKCNSILDAWLYSAGYRWSEHWSNKSFFQNFPFPTTIARAGNVPLRECVAFVAKNHNAQNSVQKASLYSLFLVFSLSKHTHINTRYIRHMSLFINQKCIISILLIIKGLFSGVNHILPNFLLL